MEPYVIFIFDTKVYLLTVKDQTLRQFCLQVIENEHLARTLDLTAVVRYK